MSERERSHVLKLFTRPDMNLHKLNFDHHKFTTQFCSKNSHSQKDIRKFGKDLHGGDYLKVSFTFFNQIRHMGRGHYINIVQEPLNKSAGQPDLVFTYFPTNLVSPFRLLPALGHSPRRSRKCTYRRCPLSLCPKHRQNWAKVSMY